MLTPLQAGKGCGGRFLGSLGNQPKHYSPPGAGRGPWKGPRPLAGSVPGAAEQSAAVLSDNSVVGHTRINQVVQGSPAAARSRSCRFMVHPLATWNSHTP